MILRRSIEKQYCFNDKHLAAQIRANKKHLMANKQDDHILISNTHWAVKFLPQRYPKAMREIGAIFNEVLINGLPDIIRIYDGQLQFTGPSIVNLFKEWDKDKKDILMPTRIIVDNTHQTRLFVSEKYPIFINSNYCQMLNEEKVSLRAIGPLKPILIYESDELVGGILPVRVDYTEKQSETFLQLASV